MEEGKGKVNLPRASPVTQAEVLVTEETPSPKITYEFFFAPHGSPTDQIGLKEKFGKADIYVPENFGWTQKQLNSIREVASGALEIVPEKPMEEYTAEERRELELMQMIYNSRKPITFVDMPQTYKNGEVETDPSWNWSGDFSDMLSSVRKESEILLGSQERREQYMIDNLGRQIKGLLEEYPSLKEKKELKVLLSLGSAHSPIHIALKGQGANVVRSFGRSLTIFNFADEGVRRLRFGRRIDDELAAKIFLEGMFCGVFKDYMGAFTEDTGKMMQVFRKLASQFSLGEAIGVFQTIKNIKDPNQSLKLLMEQELKKKEIAIPKSEEEIDELLARPLPRPNSQPPKP